MSQNIGISFIACLCFLFTSKMNAQCNAAFFSMIPQSCTGDTVNYQTLDPFDFSLQYTWTISGNGQIISGSGTNSVWVRWNGAGTNAITLNISRVAPACNISYSLMPTVFAGPTMVFNPSQPVCSFPATLTVNVSGNSPFNYLWGCNGGNATTQSIIAYTPGPYCLFVSDVNGCIGRDTVNLIQSAIPPITITNPNPSYFCPGDSVYACVNPTLGAPPAWSTGFLGQCHILYQPGTYFVLYADSNGCFSSDTITLIQYPGPNPSISFSPAMPLCADDTVYLTSNPGFSSYSWSSGALTQNTSHTYPGNANPFVDVVTVVDANGCSGTAAVTLQFLDDCVFPGDANYDGVADNNDIVEIAFAIGNTGNIRSGASTNWLGQPSVDWGNPLPSLADEKQADCNGDGVISINDTLAVTQNYGFTHLKTNTGGNDPYLQLIGLATSYSPGQFAPVGIQYLTPGGPIQPFHGVGFSIVYDDAVFNPDSLYITYPGTSPLGTRFTNYLTFSKPFPGRLDMAIAKMDGAPVNMTFADLATVYFKVRGNYVVPPGGINSPLALNRINLMEGDGTVIFPQNHTIGISLTENPNGISEGAAMFNVYPNPANNYLRITSAIEDIVAINIVDLSGRMILQHETQSSQIEGIDISRIQNGLYVVVVIGKNGTKKFTRILVER